MNRRTSGLWGKGISFPLERLYNLMASETWSDSKSETMWTGSGKCPPYQLWSSDPFKGGQLELQDVRMSCDSCHSVVDIPLEEFWRTHTTKTAMSRCPSCGVQFNADLLSAKYFKEDLLEFIKTQSGWYSLYI